MTDANDTESNHQVSRMIKASGWFLEDQHIDRDSFVSLTSETEQSFFFFAADADTLS